MKKCAGCKKKSCNGCLLYPGGEFLTDKGKNARILENFQMDEQDGLGIAVDLGTTTICVMLWDLAANELLAAVSGINPQRSVGSDVISRITYYRENREQAGKLQRLVIDQIDTLAKEALEYMPKHVHKVVIAGNTAMSEILLSLSLDGLAAAPFHKDYRGKWIGSGKTLGFQVLEAAEIIVLPAIDGYVGGDALAVYTYIKHLDPRKNILAVDIGTNGEILLLTEKGCYAASVAAGPALEGAATSYGMAAVPGAISQVKLLGSFPQQDLFCRVIQESGVKNTPPAGICGSGLMDALAVLLDLKVIDETGYLKSAAEARKEGIPERISRRIETVSGKNRILLTDKEHPVYLTAEDIRQLQLAKGAVAAGIRILLEKASLSKGELVQIYLTGAFGTHLSVESALTIGLLPDVKKEVVISVENCAGLGGIMALFSQEIQQDMDHEAEEILHVELADEENFQEYYLEEMQFAK